MNMKRTIFHNRAEVTSELMGSNLKQKQILNPKQTEELGSSTEAEKTKQNKTKRQKNKKDKTHPLPSVWRALSFCGLPPSRRRVVRPFIA